MFSYSKVFQISKKPILILVLKVESKQTSLYKKNKLKDCQTFSNLIKSDCNQVVNI